MFGDCLWIKVVPEAFVNKYLIQFADKHEAPPEPIKPGTLVTIFCGDHFRSAYVLAVNVCTALEIEFVENKKVLDWFGAEIALNSEIRQSEGVYETVIVHPKKTRQPQKVRFVVKRIFDNSRYLLGISGGIVVTLGRPILEDGFHIQEFLKADCNGFVQFHPVYIFNKKDFLAKLLDLCHLPGVLWTMPVDESVGKDINNALASFDHTPQSTDQQLVIDVRRSLSGLKSNSQFIRSLSGLTMNSSFSEEIIRLSGDRRMICNDPRVVPNLPTGISNGINGSEKQSQNATKLNETVKNHRSAQDIAYDVENRKHLGDDSVYSKWENILGKADLSNFQTQRNTFCYMVSVPDNVPADHEKQTPSDGEQTKTSENKKNASGKKNQEEAEHNSPDTLQANRQELPELNRQASVETTANCNGNFTTASMRSDSANQASASSLEIEINSEVKDKGSSRTVHLNSDSELGSIHSNRCPVLMNATSMQPIAVNTTESTVSSVVSIPRPNHPLTLNEDAMSRNMLAQQDPQLVQQRVPSVLMQSNLAGFQFEQLQPRAWRTDVPLTFSGTLTMMQAQAGETKGLPSEASIEAPCETAESMVAATNALIPSRSVIAMNPLNDTHPFLNSARMVHTFQHVLPNAQQPSSLPELMPPPPPPPALFRLPVLPNASPNARSIQTGLGNLTRQTNQNSDFIKMIDQTATRALQEAMDQVVLMLQTNLRITTTPVIQQAPNSNAGQSLALAMPPCQLLPEFLQNSPREPQPIVANMANEIFTGQQLCKQKQSRKAEKPKKAEIPKSQQPHKPKAIRKPRKKQPPAQTEALANSQIVIASTTAMNDNRLVPFNPECNKSCCVGRAIATNAAQTTVSPAASNVAKLYKNEERGPKKRALAELNDFVINHPQVARVVPFCKPAIPDVPIDLTIHNSLTNDPSPQSANTHQQNLVGIVNPAMDLARPSSVMTPGSSMLYKSSGQVAAHIGNPRLFGSQSSDHSPPISELVIDETASQYSSPQSEEPAAKMPRNSPAQPKATQPNHCHRGPNEHELAQLASASPVQNRRGRNARKSNTPQQVADSIQWSPTVGRPAQVQVESVSHCMSLENMIKVMDQKMGSTGRTTANTASTTTTFTPSQQIQYRAPTSQVIPQHRAHVAATGTYRHVSQATSAYSMSASSSNEHAIQSQYSQASANHVVTGHPNRLEMLYSTIDQQILANLAKMPRTQTTHSASAVQHNYQQANHSDRSRQRSISTYPTATITSDPRMNQRSTNNCLQANQTMPSYAHVPYFQSYPSAQNYGLANDSPLNQLAQLSSYSDMSLNHSPLNQHSHQFQSALFNHSRCNSTAGCVNGNTAQPRYFGQFYPQSVNYPSATNSNYYAPCYPPPNMHQMSAYYRMAETQQANSFIYPNHQAYSSQTVASRANASSSSSFMWNSNMTVSARNPFEDEESAQSHAATSSATYRRTAPSRPYLPDPTVRR